MSFSFNFQVPNGDCGDPTATGQDPVTASKNQAPPAPSNPLVGVERLPARRMVATAAQLSAWPQSHEKVVVGSLCYEKTLFQAAKQPLANAQLSLLLKETDLVPAV